MTTKLKWNYSDNNIASLDINDDDDFLNIPITTILREHLRISNNGLDLHDAIDAPFLDTIHRTPNTNEQVLKVAFHQPKRVTCRPDFEFPSDIIDDRDFDAFDEWLNRPEDPCPLTAVVQIAKTSIGKVAPETQIFKASTSLKPLCAAVKFVTHIEAAGNDSRDYIASFERWWNLAPGSCSYLSNKYSPNASLARIIGSYSKRSSYLYGFDNLAGLFEIVRTGLDRSSFLMGKDLTKGLIPAVDFGRINAMVRYTAAIN
jgi:hypothetical protein